jgi:hypothetical protein
MCGLVVLKGANIFQQSRDVESITLSEDRILRETHYLISIHLFSSSVEQWFPIDYHWVRYVLREAAHSPELAREIFERRRGNNLFSRNLILLTRIFTFLL